MQNLDACSDYRIRTDIHVRATRSLNWLAINCVYLSYIAVFASKWSTRQDSNLRCKSFGVNEVRSPLLVTCRKQDACNNAIYWIRTNVSSIAASALATKLNARMVDTNVTLLYASSNSTRSKWPNHYDSLLYQLSYVLTFWRGRLDSNQRPTAWNAKWTLLYGS